MIWFEVTFKATKTSTTHCLYCYNLSATQAGVWMSIMLSLEIREWKGPKPSGSINTSANWCWEQISNNYITPSWILLRTRWQSNSICLVQTWRVGLKARWIADWLSQYKNKLENRIHVSHPTNTITIVCHM